MPYLVIFGAGLAVGIYGVSKAEDFIKLAMIGGGIYVAGKYVKAW